jgi:U3 small nucleolar ribonucleoprotein protein LCP5
MDGAPLLESTSGLSTRPVQVNRHSNSISAKRAAELQRMNEFEEENMTRLVTTKREAKRRREDEEALALGYGVGGSARGRARRQNGLEAELEGVLGARGSRGVWDNVSQSMGHRADLLERGKASQRERASGGGDASRAKKARFDKDIAGRKRR